MTPEAAMDKLNYKRYCCRKHLAFPGRLLERALDSQERNETAMQYVGDRFTFADTGSDQNARVYLAR